MAATCGNREDREVAVANRQPECTKGGYQIVLGYVPYRLPHPWASRVSVSWRQPAWERALEAAVWLLCSYPKFIQVLNLTWPGRGDNEFTTSQRNRQNLDFSGRHSLSCDLGLQSRSMEHTTTETPEPSGVNTY